MRPLVLVQHLIMFAAHLCLIAAGYFIGQAQPIGLIVTIALFFGFTIASVYAEDYL